MRKAGFTFSSIFQFKTANTAGASDGRIRQASILDRFLMGRWWMGREAGLMEYWSVGLVVDGSERLQFQHCLIARRSPAFGLKLFEDPSDVVVNGPDTDFQDSGDCSVLFSLHHPMEHLGLAGSKANSLEILCPGNDLRPCRSQRFKTLKVPMRQSHVGQPSSEAEPLHR